MDPNSLLTFLYPCKIISVKTIVLVMFNFHCRSELNKHISHFTSCNAVFAKKVHHIHILSYKMKILIGLALDFILLSESEIHDGVVKGMCSFSFLCFIV